jgi:predicted transcriptional regulator
MKESLKGLFEDENEPTTYREEDVIIMSLQPYAYELIKSGTKKMEYRTRFRKRPTIAVVYVSAPVKAICGVVLMDKAIIGTPDRIAAIAEAHIKGNGASVYDYLKDKKQGYAIPISGFVVLKEVIPLDELRAKYGFVAPQSYVGAKIYPELSMRLAKALDGKVAWQE